MRRIVVFLSLSSSLAAAALISGPTLPATSWIKSVPSGSMDTWRSSHMKGTVTRKKNKARFQDTNTLKNRYDAPTDPLVLDPEALLYSQSGATDLVDRDGTMQTHIGSNASLQRTGASIEGWIGKVIKEKGETCNDYQQTSDDGADHEKYVDEHIYFFSTEADYAAFIGAGARHNIKDRVIDIELTPRVKELAKQAGFTWTKKTLDTLVGKHVRITGWLLDDWDHAPVSFRDGAKKRIDRGTCWEIHPITKIERLD